MNIYPTTQMAQGKETAKDREAALKKMLHEAFEEWHCDYRISLDDIGNEWTAYREKRGY